MENYSIPLQASDICFTEQHELSHTRITQATKPYVLLPMQRLVENPQPQQPAVTPPLIISQIHELQLIEQIRVRVIQTLHSTPGHGEPLQRQPHVLLDDAEYLVVELLQLRTVVQRQRLQRLEVVERVSVYLLQFGRAVQDQRPEGMVVEVSSGQ